MSERDQVITGVTLQFKFDHLDEAIYVTINFINSSKRGKIPYELFINSKNPSHLEWSTLCSRLVSAILRKGGNTSFIWKELQQMFWVEPFWYKGKQYYSILAVIGERLEKLIEDINKEQS